MTFQPVASRELYVQMPDESPRPRKTPTCYKVQLLVAAMFLIGGIVATSVGVPALVRTLQEGKVEIVGTVNVQAFTFNESITFNIDKSECLKNGIVSIMGLFTFVLSAGMLLGLSCKN